jgi:hypothetical protein
MSRESQSRCEQDRSGTERQGFAWRHRHFGFADLLLDRFLAGGGSGDGVGAG